MASREDRFLKAESFDMVHLLKTLAKEFEGYEEEDNLNEMASDLDDMLNNIQDYLYELDRDHD